MVSYVQYDRFHSPAGDSYREARLKRVLFRCRIVAVTNNPPAMAGCARRSSGGHVEVRAVPEDIGLRRVALVDYRAGVAPGMGGTIITVNVVLLSGSVE